MAQETSQLGSDAPERISAPGLSLPKGGGAVRGIGETFAANPVTGTGSLSVPIAVSPGRGGFGPQLSLSYDSGAGNGPFGFGWSLSLPASQVATGTVRMIVDGALVEIESVRTAAGDRLLVTFDGGLLAGRLGDYTGELAVTVTGHLTSGETFPGTGLVQLR